MSQLSGLVWKAIERRTAISGLTPERPFRMLESVFRLTPSARAASGDRQVQGLQAELLEHFTRVQRIMHLLDRHADPCNLYRYGLQAA